MGPIHLTFEDRERTRLRADGEAEAARIRSDVGTTGGALDCSTIGNTSSTPIATENHNMRRYHLEDERSRSTTSSPIPRIQAHTPQPRHSSSSGISLMTPSTSSSSAYDSVAAPSSQRGLPVPPPYSTSLQPDHSLSSSQHLTVGPHHDQRSSSMTRAHSEGESRNIGRSETASNGMEGISGSTEAAAEAGLSALDGGVVAGTRRPLPAPPGRHQAGQPSPAMNIPTPPSHPSAATMSVSKSNDFGLPTPHPRGSGKGLVTGAPEGGKYATVTGAGRPAGLAGAGTCHGSAENEYYGSSTGSGMGSRTVSASSRPLPPQPPTSSQHLPTPPPLSASIKTSSALSSQTYPQNPAPPSWQSQPTSPSTTSFPQGNPYGYPSFPPFGQMSPNGMMPMGIPPYVPPPGYPSYMPPGMTTTSAVGDSSSMAQLSPRGMAPPPFYGMGMPPGVPPYGMPPGFSSGFMPPGYPGSMLPPLQTPTQIFQSPSQASASAHNQSTPMPTRAELQATPSTPTASITPFNPYESYLPNTVDDSQTSDQANFSNGGDQSYHRSEYEPMSRYGDNEMPYQAAEGTHAGETPHPKTYQSNDHGANPFDDYVAAHGQEMHPYDDRDPAYSARSTRNTSTSGSEDTSQQTHIFTAETSVDKADGLVSPSPLEAPHQIELRRLANTLSMTSDAASSTNDSQQPLVRRRSRHQTPDHVQANIAHRESTASVHTQNSAVSRGEGPSSIQPRGSLAPSWNQVQEGGRQPSRWVQNKLFLHQSHANQPQASMGDNEHDQAYYDDPEEAYDDVEVEEEEEENEMNFFNPSLLSHVSVQLKDRVERNSHVKGGIAWQASFTGRDLVTTIQSFMPDWTKNNDFDRRFALGVARSLQNQLFFVEVDWDIKPIRDTVDDVYQFMSEVDGMGGSGYELPTGVETMATKCYSPSCQGDGRCYSAMCPYRVKPDALLSKDLLTVVIESDVDTNKNKNKDWTADVDRGLLRQLSESEVKRQAIIHQAILAEEQYEADLNAVETLFISPLRISNPPVIRSLKDLEDLINDLFGNILELREANARLLEFFTVRQREDGGIITTIGDGFLMAAADFRSLYPEYIGHLPRAEERLRNESQNNANFRFFLDRISRQNESRRMDLKYLITRPSTQLSRYPQILEAILAETPHDSPDATFLAEAIKAIRNLGLAAQLKLWQTSNGRDDYATTSDQAPRRDPALHRESIGEKNWYQLVSVEDLAIMTADERKLQETIWELIKGEMSYVADLKVIETVFIDGLREADDPIIDRSRLEVFLDEIFHNYRSLLDIHSGLLASLHARQEEQHPKVGAIGDLIYDAALRWQEAIIEYGSHFPKAKYALNEEKRNNPRFVQFLDRCRNHPLTAKQSIDHFLLRPVPRLLRYPLLMNDILKMLKKTHQVENPDMFTIPMVTELIAEQGKAIDKGVSISESKVDLWLLAETLIGGKFGDTVVKDLDLRNPMRELIHRGKVLRQPESTISTTWSELNALLFDNYFVLTKVSKSSRHSDAPPRYYINRRPIPLELLTLGSFVDPSQSRSLGLLKSFRSSDRYDSTQGTASSETESRTVYPFTFSFIGQGQFGGQYTLWTDSAQSRKDWFDKLNHAKALRAADIEANKIFELHPLSLDTFFAPLTYALPSKTQESEPSFTGRVTCSVPFRTPDRRELIAVGCSEGVWIGLRSDPRSLRKVLHVKSVTQCAVLEQFSLFLVLSNKTLLAYPLEALVPTSHQPGNAPRGHQKLSDKHEVQYFVTGQLAGRTLVVYMRRKGLDSVFRCLEPIAGREAEESRNRRPFGNLNLLNAKNDWFRVYKEFFVPSEAFSINFLRNKIIVVCARGFEIIDLTELNPGAIPVFDPSKVKVEPALAVIKSRCEGGAKPLGIFRSTESEFLLCYDTFGFFVDRHGFPNRDLRILEWEGRPESVGFHPPYVVLFSAPFMEIRHITDGRLLQIYCASDIRCTWDGSGCNPGYGLPVPGPRGYPEENISPEARLHIVKRSDVTSGQRRARGVGQDVFELCPTLLLNNPLRDSTSGDSNYFQPAPEVHYPNGGPSNQYGYSPWN